MRVLTTGASGFVGSWLMKELADGGHDATALPIAVDIRDMDAVRAAVNDVHPDAIAHLAAVAFAPDAKADPEVAYSVAVTGTVNVLEAARAMTRPPAILVTGSSEVYGEPMPDELPITENNPLRARGAYGTSKIAQESVALAFAWRYGLHVFVTRSFNHIGPGQRPDFVVPAIAGRIASATHNNVDHIVVGNVDVKRDFADVRDVVRAYRLLLETATRNGSMPPALAVNVSSGSSVTIRSIAEQFCRLAGVDMRLMVDPALVRAEDPPEIRGDHSLLTSLTGWRPEIALSQTLHDVWDSVVASDG
jgi:GDP-4-dehydro-6-deoxy-D-mannose reductase